VIVPGHIKVVSNASSALLHDDVGDDPDDITQKDRAIPYLFPERLGIGLYTRVPDLPIKSATPP